MKFRIAQGKNSQWYWSLIARNGKTIADGSEGYASAGNCRRAVNRVMTGLSERVCLPSGALYNPVRIEVVH